MDVKRGKVLHFTATAKMIIPIDCDKLNVYSLLLRKTNTKLQRVMYSKCTDISKWNYKNQVTHRKAEKRKQKNKEGGRKKKKKTIA